MTDTSSLEFQSALEDFRRARREAALEQVVSRLTGRPSTLLSFEDVRQKLRATGTVERGLQEIPLEAIVGSVGRYTDFTRSFMPRNESARERWARVQVAMLAGRFPPIEVYKIGEGYFVVDGNHRVSIARQMNLDTIPAYVTEVKTRVPLSTQDDVADVQAKAYYAEFLEDTGLDKLRPEAELRLSIPERYHELEEHIRIHRYYMEQERSPDEPVSLAEAAAHWYDEVYLPVVMAIRERGLLRDFPNRTETDLYLWITRHREQLQAALGWDVAPVAAAESLAEQAGESPRRVVARVGERLREALTPDVLEWGPEPGQWRQERQLLRHRVRLLNDLLVPISGEPEGWSAVDQAIIVAQHEGARLLGLHVVPSELRLLRDETKEIEQEFERRCAAAGVACQFVFDIGAQVASHICDRARWSDLIVINVAHPPATTPLARLKPGFHTLIRRCPRPILATSGAVSPLDRPLLAYDGSPKAREALYAAAYLASTWNVPLHVVTVSETLDEVSAPLLDARHYLEAQGVEATFLQKRGRVAEAILRTAEEYNTNLTLMGGYGFGVMREVVLGSAVDQVLRESRWPVLISR